MFTLKNISIAMLAAFSLIGCESSEARDHAEVAAPGYRVRIDGHLLPLVVTSTPDYDDSGDIVFSAAIEDREFDVSIGVRKSTVASVSGQVLIQLELTDNGVRATNEHGQSVNFDKTSDFSEHSHLFDAEAAILLDASVLDGISPDLAKRPRVWPLLIALCTKIHIGSDGWSADWTCNFFDK